MRFSKPSWVTHSDNHDGKRVTLYSCHVHPDGSRLATGGLDAKIRIWATLPIIRSEADQANMPKKLCTLSMHTGPVLCVRWSHSGRWLASGSDDAIIMIWDLDPGGSGRVWGSDDANIEGWKALKRLPGHQSDVTDLGWSPKDRYLASVGLDSKVIIWCGHTLEPLRKLDMHQGFVKGVCWDPVGEFLATQSDDKSVKVWRTTDWGLEATVTKPFQDSPGSTFFRRLSWSPDGAHITASNAMNNNGYVFVAAVIARNEWTSDICLVGHENTVEVACYNPHIFLRDPGGEVQSTNICSVVALGADDLSISIWQTKSPRPLLVARDAFDGQIFDLSWSMDGMTLYACSADGSLGVFDFDANELDGITTLEDKEVYLRRFGFRAPDHTPATAVPNRHDQLQQHMSGGMNGSSGFLTPDAQVAAAAAMDPGPAFDSKGRRRIKPLFVGALSNAPGTIATSAPPAPYAPNGASPLPPPVQVPRYPQPPRHNNYQAYSQPPPVPQLHSHAPHRQPSGSSTSQFDYAHHSRQSFSSPAGGFAGGGFDADGDSSMGWEASNGKRKASEIGGDDDSISTMSTLNGKPSKARTLGGDRRREPVGPIKELRSTLQGTGFSGPSGSRIRLDIPPLKNFLAVNSQETEGDVFEARNFDDGRPSEVTFIRGKQTQFLDYPAAPPLSLVVTGCFCAVALEDSALNVYSLTGRRLLPTLALDSPCTIFEGSGTCLMAVTAAGKLHVWNVKTQKASFPPASLDTILTPNASIASAHVRPNGAPVIVLSSGIAYTYDPDLSCFTKIVEARWGAGSDAWEGRLRANKLAAGRGAISALENAVSELTLEPVASLVGRPQWWEAAYTLGHLESRQHAAKVLDSPSEYKAALLLYAKRIADEGFRAKAEELIKELCGPLYWKLGKEESWCPMVLGMQKRDLLKDVLSTFAKSKTLTKLGQDWQDILKKATSE